MKCFFINLDAAPRRRQSLEDNFARHAGQGWSLERFVALGTDVVSARHLKGHLRPSEMACALSHFELLRQKRDETDAFLVLEDDALFGPNSCRTMRDSVDWLNAHEEWDLLFPDLCIAQIGVMADLLALRRQLMAKGQTRILNPRGMAFSSATSYILHPRAIPKILSATPKGEWNVPYDLLLRQLVQEGRLRARYIFPFAMSLQETSNSSTITPGDETRTGFVWYLFRRMVWRDGDYEQHIADTQIVAQNLDSETWAYARLWAAMADPSFIPK
jgi:GR25 family glycosyltransferase involved in LPS biosynthesis